MAWHAMNWHKTGLGMMAQVAPCGMKEEAEAEEGAAAAAATSSGGLQPSPTATARRRQSILSPPAVALSALPGRPSGERMDRMAFTVARAFSFRGEIKWERLD